MNRRLSAGKSLFGLAGVLSLLLGVITCRPSELPPIVSERLRLSVIREPYGLVTTIQYDVAGRINQLLITQNADTNLVRYNYSQNRLISYDYFYSTVTNTQNPANGYTATFSYNSPAVYGPFGDPYPSAYDQQITMLIEPFTNTLIGREYRPFGLNYGGYQQANYYFQGDQIAYLVTEFPFNDRSRQASYYGYSFKNGAVDSVRYRYEGVGLRENSLTALSYDTKKNPYYRLMLPKIDPVLYDSPANLVKEYIGYRSLNEIDYKYSQRLYTYTYNEAGYPITRQVINPMYGTGLTQFEYESY